jgi:hypothetical protein
LHELETGTLLATSYMPAPPAVKREPSVEETNIVSPSAAAAFDDPYEDVVEAKEWFDPNAGGERAAAMYRFVALGETEQPAFVADRADLISIR